VAVDRRIPFIHDMLNLANKVSLRRWLVKCLAYTLGLRTDYGRVRMEEKFNESVEMVWFRDVGLYNLRMVPTPIGFFSFREFLLIGIGALLTWVGVKLFWGFPIGEVLSFIPLVFLFYMAKKKTGMLAFEVRWLASVFPSGTSGTRPPASAGTKRKGNGERKAAPTPTEVNTIEVTFSEKRPIPAEITFTIPLPGKEPKPVTLFLDGEEVDSTRTSPFKIDDKGVHYILYYRPDVTDIGRHMAEIRFVGSTVPLQELDLQVRGEGVTPV